MRWMVTILGILLLILANSCSKTKYLSKGDQQAISAIIDLHYVSNTKVAFNALVNYFTLLDFTHRYKNYFSEDFHPFISTTKQKVFDPSFLDNMLSNINAVKYKIDTCKWSLHNNFYKQDIFELDISESVTCKNKITINYQNKEILELPNHKTKGNNTKCDIKTNYLLFSVNQKTKSIYYLSEWFFSYSLSIKKVWDEIFIPIFSNKPMKSNYIDYKNIQPIIIDIGLQKDSLYYNYFHLILESDYRPESFQLIKQKKEKVIFRFYSKEDERIYRLEFNALRPYNFKIIKD